MRSKERWLSDDYVIDFRVPRAFEGKTRPTFSLGAKKIQSLKNSSLAILESSTKTAPVLVSCEKKSEAKKIFRMHGDLLLGAIFPQFGENEMLADGWAAIISRG